MFKEEIKIGNVKFNNPLNKIDKTVVRETAKGIMEDGVEVVKDGVSSTVKMVLFKIALTIILVVGSITAIISGGVIGTATVMEKIK